jgi:hypothetical protein
MNCRDAANGQNPLEAAERGRVKSGDTGLWSRRRAHADNPYEQETNCRQHMQGGLPDSNSCRIC